MSLHHPLVAVADLVDPQRNYILTKALSVSRLDTTSGSATTSDAALIVSTARNHVLGDLISG